MPYFTPPGGDVTAAYARGLMGLQPMSFYVPNVRQGLNGLGALRFNRSVARGYYQLPFYEAPPVDRGLGQIEADPTMLFTGIGLLGLGLYLFGKKRSGRSSRRRRRR